MPLYYDLNRAFTTSATPATEVTGWRGATVANQETVSILGIYATAVSGTAGGGQFRLKTNTGTAASGGTSQTPAAKNLRYGVAAQSTWSNDATTITAGTTLITRLSVGFAQTGGQGGYVPIVPQDAIQMMPNATNPVDVEVTHRANAASIPVDAFLEISEGI
jgi:hypothetical protein